MADSFFFFWFSFDSLVVLLREKPVIAAAKRCLQRIHLLTVFRHGSPSRVLSPGNVNVRVVLAAFMIAYRPAYVFESMAPLETALLEAATPLITTFQAICLAVVTGGSFASVPHELTRNFATMLYEYLKRFKAWKIPDEAKLTLRIKHGLTALYQAEEYLPEDEPADSKLRNEFRTQIERLRDKLRQIAGADALQQFDAQRAAVHIPVVARGGTTPLPRRMTNEQLAHELLWDPTFQLDEAGGCGVANPVFHRIRESFHRHFWDSLVDDLRLAIPCFVRVLRVLSEVLDGIKDLVGSRESNVISEAVDLDFIKQQAEQGLYAWESAISLVEAIVAVIQRVQSPKRDLETKALWSEQQQAMVTATTESQPRVFCGALEFLFDRVNALRIDAANARLRIIAPVIKEHGIDYERGKFSDKLNDGSLTLERTTVWIRDTVKEQFGPQSMNRLDDLLEGKATAFVHVHSAAMLHLVTRATIKPELCPETLLFDVHRLNDIRNEIQYVATCVALLVTFTHAITATKSADAKREVDKVSAAVVGCSKTIGAALERVVHAVKETALLTVGQKDALVRALQHVSQPTDAVNQLM